MMFTQRKHDYSLDIKCNVVIEIYNDTQTKTQVIIELCIAKSTLATWIK